MIDREHELPLARQAALRGLSRSRLYYEPRPVPAAELAIMRRIDALHLNHPFAGSRTLRDLLRGEGVVIGRELVRTMMRRMCIEALYRRPNTSKPALEHKIYPYLLRGLAVERPNQVWAMDITYIPMARGFVYLAAVVDWFTRRVLAWRLSITMEVDFCIDAVEEALAKYGRPEIFNTDQGSQFTSAAFTGLLLKNKIAISMDGRGSCSGTMSLSSGYGGRSNTRRSICGRTTASPMLAPRSASGTWFSITRYVPIRALTREHRITCLPSTICRNPRQHEFAAIVGSLLRSGYLRLPAQRPDHGLLRNQPAGDPLIDGETLSRPSRPPLSSIGGRWGSPTPMNCERGTRWSLRDQRPVGVLILLTFSVERAGPLDPICRSRRAT